MKRIIAAVAALALAAGTPAAARADNTEAQIGQQVYQQLQQKGEIIASSPYYAILNPIAQQIKRVADPQYQYPFNFILVHEKQPNAFAVPGGNVYVTDSLMTFVKNREELAGVLCHETSHDIHHDVMNNMAKDQRAATNVTLGAIAAQLLLGQRASGIINTGANAAYTISASGYGREVETAADLKGSETCAQAGFNPWGMVWLFQQFQKADTGGSMEMLSDHPRDDHRISDLENHFRTMPHTFGRFSSDMSTATPLRATGSRNYGYR
ncbi:MAG: M48 family metallopeptidase [Candidatus Velthaea sp.]